MSVLLEKAFYCGGIIQKSHYNFAVLCSFLLGYNNLVAIENTSVDHAVAFYPEHECLLVGKQFGWDGEVILDIFLSQNRLSRSYRSQNRYIYHLSACQVKIIIQDFNRPGFGGITTDIAVFLQSLQMRMNGRCGL